MIYLLQKKTIKRRALLLVLLLVSLTGYTQHTAKGFVYIDINKNGKKDQHETGIANVAVSNGTDVVLTDDKGYYSIPITKGNTVFVIKPSGYQTVINKYFIPQFFYHHKPDYKSKNFTYKGVSPTGNLPKRINFPLYKKQESNNFTAIIFGDPQVSSMNDVDFFSRKIINDIIKTEKNKKALLGITLGDIVADKLNLMPVYNKKISEIGLPWYNVIGNHDINYDAPTDDLSDETFQKHFGVANYAFNYGNTHFIVLDNIIYPDPRGYAYWGGYRLDQLLFLENNLKHVSKDKLIILSQHICMKDEWGFRPGDRQKLFELLKDYENVLILSAHTHLQQQIEYGPKEGWHGENPLHEYNVATTCGDWYSGVKDINGIPDATMRDGTPQGYALLNVRGNTYDIDYKVAGRELNYQMSIYSPKVVPYKGFTTSQIFVNFFMGSKNDKVEYRIDKSEWQEMNYTKMIDPSYLVKLLEWDFTEKLLNGRRPSNATECTHLWSGPLKLDLPPGEHTIEVKATDRYGKQHIGKRKYTILE